MLEASIVFYLTTTSFYSLKYQIGINQRTFKKCTNITKKTFTNYEKYSDDFNDPYQKHCIIPLHITMSMKYSALFTPDYTAYMYHDLIIATVVTGTLSSYNLYL
jgi:hypothetical protein